MRLYDGLSSVWAPRDSRAGQRMVAHADGKPRNYREDHQVAKTTLVTGGSGYIGALLVKELREAQH